MAILPAQWGLGCRNMHGSHKLPPSAVNLWMKLGGKPKRLPLNFGYHDVMRIGHIAQYELNGTY